MKQPLSRVNAGIIFECFNDPFKDDFLFVLNFTYYSVKRLLMQYYFCNCN